MRFGGIATTENEPWYEETKILKIISTICLLTTNLCKARASRGVCYLALVVLISEIKPVALTAWSERPGVYLRTR